MTPDFRAITVDKVRETILAHVPSLTDKDDRAICAAILAPDTDTADLALRTCACGQPIDGFYQYVDHLIAVFGGESHIGG